jgi:hypothetical protein
MVTVRFNPLRWLLVVLCGSFIAVAAAPLHAQDTNKRLEQMLKETGYKFTTHNANTWSIDFERTKLGKFKVILSTGNDIVVTFAILAKKANINKTTKMMETLLGANHEYDYVKVGLDKDGDMFVRIDTQIRTIDAKELKEVINQVANASEEVYIKVAGSIKK